MGLSEILRAIIRSISPIFSGSVVSTAIVCTVFPGNGQVSVALFWQLMLASVIAALAMFIYYSPTELSKRGLKVRSALHFLAITAIVLVSASVFGWIDFSSILQVTVIFVLVCAVYALVCVILYCAQKATADKMNEQLKELR